MGIEVPASESLESPKAENEVNWKKAADKTGFIYSGKNTFKSGEGEFTTVGQGDSFAGSHAYMLLADVPGASANSGATITAEDSNGKAAFVATETRGTTEQEVAVGAGSELKTVVNQVGSSDFLQLAMGAAKRKVNVGSATITWPGGTNNQSVEITHSLGATPLAVVANAADALGNRVITTESFGATKFKLIMRTVDGTNPAASSTTKYSWIAIG